VALDCDGAVAIDKGVADCDGVIRDSKGNFKAVFSFNIRLIRVDSDSLVAIKLIKDGCTKEHQSIQLVQDIHRNYNCKGTIMWNYICRKANQVAETLTKLSLSLNDNYIVFNLVSNILQLSLTQF
jgi:hypothetical protein